MLGTWIDTTLRMEKHVATALSKVRPKTYTILRSRRFYNVPDLMNQYKTHVLCLLEGTIGGFYHALDTILEPLNQLQTGFIKEVSLSIEGAFLNQNLAPLATRRDIAMLGLIYKCVHGITHQDLQSLFLRCAPAKHSHATRLQKHRHPLQLEEYRPGTQHVLLRRSIFELIRIWNTLPEPVVTAESVSKIQTLLTRMVRVTCQRGDKQWGELQSPRTVLLKVTAYFDEIFSLC